MNSSWKLPREKCTVDDADDPDGALALRGTDMRVKNCLVPALIPEIRGPPRVTSSKSCLFGWRPHLKCKYRRPSDVAARLQAAGGFGQIAAEIDQVRRRMRHADISQLEQQHQIDRRAG